LTFSHETLGLAMKLQLESTRPGVGSIQKKVDWMIL